MFILTSEKKKLEKSEQMNGTDEGTRQNTTRHANATITIKQYRFQHSIAVVGMQLQLMVTAKVAAMFSFLLSVVVVFFP